MGAIVFSYTSQIFLPSLEESMTKRSQFKSMLGWSYAASGLVKVLLSLVCFLTWSDATKEVVTDNLPTSVRPLINCLLAIKALLSYPLPYFVAIELIEDWVVTSCPGAKNYFGHNSSAGDCDYDNISVYPLQDFVSTVADENGPRADQEGATGRYQQQQQQPPVGLEKMVLKNLNNFVCIKYNLFKNWKKSQRFFSTYFRGYFYGESN